MINLIRKLTLIFMLLISLNAGDFEFYKKSCDEGYMTFCQGLGFMYEEGKEIKQDYIKAEQLYKKSCKNGDYMGCMGLERLAKMYYNQLDYIKSKILFHELCNNNHINSCYNLAVQYEESKNYLEAEKLYTKACKKNHFNACTNLGFLYYNGQGITKNYSKSFKLFNKSCDGNNIIGCYNLGLMYADAQFVKQNINKAYSLFEKVCDAGEKEGCQTLDRLKKIILLSHNINAKEIINPINPICINDVKRATYTMMLTDGQDESTSMDIAFTIAKNLSNKKNKEAVYTVYEYENTNKYHFGVIKENNECTLTYIGYTKNKKSYVNMIKYIDKQPIIGCFCK